MRLLTGVLCLSVVLAAPLTEDLYTLEVQSLLQHTVSVEAPKEGPGTWGIRGAGVVIERPGDALAILTARHIGRGEPLRACSTLEPGSCTLLLAGQAAVGERPEDDWVVWEIQELLLQTAPVRCYVHDPLVGQKTHQIGYPQGNLLYLPGVISGRSWIGDDLLVISSLGLQGVSGAPVFVDGCLAAITTAVPLARPPESKDRQMVTNLSLAVPVQEQMLK